MTTEERLTFVLTVSKAWVEAFFTANFVAGYTKTDHPTYIEQLRKQ